MGETQAPARSSCSDNLTSIVAGRVTICQQEGGGDSTEGKIQSHSQSKAPGGGVKPRMLPGQFQMTAWVCLETGQGGWMRRALGHV